AQEAQQLLVPVVRMDVEKQRARRVGDVGYVGAVAGELPGEPRVDRAERELAALGSRACARHLVKQPGDLGAAEIGVDYQAGALANEALRTDIPQFLAKRGGAAVLPHDGVVDRLAVLPVPHDGGLALNRDADRHEVFGRDIAFSQRLARYVALRGDDLARVVLDPAGLWKDLAEPALADCDRAAVLVEDDGARAGGALVECENVLHFG